MREKFPGIPILFCRFSDEIYPIPVLLRKFKVKQPGAATNFQQCQNLRSIHSYSQLFQKKPDFITLDNWKLQSLCGKPEFPEFLPKEFCIEFCLEQTTLEPVTKYEVKPKRITEIRKAETEKITESLDSIIIESDLESETDPAEGENKSIELISGTNPSTEPKKEPEVKPEPVKMTDNSQKYPKLQLDKWASTEKDGDCLEWLKNAIFLINLNSVNAPEGCKISHIINAINNAELKTKIINEFETEPSDNQNIEKLTEIITKHTKRDTITYRKALKSLTYDPDMPMAEFYAKIERLVSKSMELDPKTDSVSIKKLSSQWFLEKLPSVIVTQMQDATFDEGEELAAKSEKIRSFQKLFLQDKELNHLRAQTNSRKNDQKNGHKNDKNDSQSHQPGNGHRENKEMNLFSGQQGRKYGYGPSLQCTHCGKTGHIDKDCWQKKQGQAGQNKRCNICGKNGHLAKDCWQKNNGQYGQKRGPNRPNNGGYSGFRSNNRYYENNQNTQYNGNNRRNSYICEYCGHAGHGYGECRNLKGMIARGKVPQNWAPGNQSNQNNGGRAPRNPLFQ